VNGRARAAALLALASAAAVTPSCRCRGKASVGDKQGYACAEVPSKDAHDEVDLGAGRKLVRDGVRAEIRGLAADAQAIVTSFETGVAPVALPAGPGQSDLVVVVAGLGGVDRGSLAAGLSTIAQRAVLVIAVAGPGDDLDVVRAAIGDAGKRVVDGAVVRAVRVGGVELVTLPGGDDPPALPEHGRGCVLRPDDARALAQKLGPAAAPRAIVAWSAPGRDPAHPTPADLVPDATVWLVAGPADDAWGSPLELGASASAAPPASSASSSPTPAALRAPIVPVPRARTPRSTSAPARVAPGFVTLRVENGALVLRDG
jgi:hypothetical protein